MINFSISCLNFWDEDWWFLSLRVFRLLSSSLLLFPQYFGQYVLLLQVFVELRNLPGTSNYILYWIHGVTCSDSVSHNRVKVLSIPVLLLACGNNNKDEDNSPKTLNDNFSMFSNTLQQCNFLLIILSNLFFQWRTTTHSSLKTFWFSL